MQVIKNLYLDSANLVWNGNAISGKDAIVKFLEDLPTSTTTLSSLDSQPVNGKALTGLWHQTGGAEVPLDCTHMPVFTIAANPPEFVIIIRKSKLEYEFLND